MDFNYRLCRDTWLFIDGFAGAHGLLLQALEDLQGPMFFLIQALQMHLAFFAYIFVFCLLCIGV